MPQSGGEKFSKIQFNRIDKRKDINKLKTSVPSFSKPNKSRHSHLPKEVPDITTGRTRIVGDIPTKSTINAVAKNMSLGHKNAIANKLTTRDTFLNKKVSSSRINAKTFMEKDNEATRLFSTLISTGKLLRHKVNTPIEGRRVPHEAKETRRLAQSKILQLLQALVEQPLPFLDLHARFGVSKRSVRGFVKKKLVMELWGHRNIGVKFKLTDKGKNYLKKLEEAAKYEPKTEERSFIRLKSKT